MDSTSPLAGYFLTPSPDAVDAETPLNPAELQVLRAQYEKEGEMVGVQTKFNFAWVRQLPPPSPFPLLFPSLLPTCSYIPPPAPPMWKPPS